jgi:hypothetical protein
MMAHLEKVWVAFFYDTKGKKPFAHEKVIAPNMAAAETKAEDWAETKYLGRVKNIVIERSKGEVLV